MDQHADGESLNRFLTNCKFLKDDAKIHNSVVNAGFQNKY